MPSEVTPSSPSGSDARRPHAWERYGPLGEDCFLALINTVDDLGKSRRLDAIPDQATAARWAVRAGVVGPDEEVGEQDLAALHRFREDAWRVLGAVAADRPAPASALHRLRTAIEDATHRARFVVEGRDGRWSAGAGRFAIHDRIALQAAETWQSGALATLRECHRCTALFLDDKRGAPRRFCRPGTCGNRDKVERHRARRRAERSG
jgi:predicted RNA-binding Zn ribbon-like protein